jgi:dolichol-phosphate mannosyltransferase
VSAPRAPAAPGLDLSVVVPVFNEEAAVEDLIEEISAALDGALQYEIIYVDDGSTDRTPERLAPLKQDFPRLRVVRLAERCGQSTAIWVGARVARAPWIATLDGDGQDDPRDIHRLLERRDATAGAQPGLLVGWRRERHDSLVRRLASRVANAVRSRILRDGTTDAGCGLKLVRRDVFLDLPFFDHMHRFLPALVQRADAQVVSVPVQHRGRRAGRSKYGILDRLWVGIVDLFGVAWLKRRARFPRVDELD